MTLYKQATLFINNNNNTLNKIILKNIKSILLVYFSCVLKVDYRTNVMRMARYITNIQHIPLKVFESLNFRVVKSNYLPWELPCQFCLKSNLHTRGIPGINSLNLLLMTFKLRRCHTLR